MSLELTTPKAVGDLDAADYTHAKVTLYRHDLQNNQIHMTVEYGIETDGVFTPGKFSDPTAVVIEGAAYGTLMASLPIDGDEILYDGVARVLYGHLISEELYIGTIV